MTITRGGCQWAEDGIEGPWATSCGHYFSLNEGTPSDNGMKYCCFCGRPLAEVRDEESEPR